MIARLEIPKFGWVLCSFAGAPLLTARTDNGAHKGFHEEGLVFLNWDSIKTRQQAQDRFSAKQRHSFPAFRGERLSKSQPSAPKNAGGRCPAARGHHRSQYLNKPVLIACIGLQYQ